MMLRGVIALLVASGFGGRAYATCDATTCAAKDVNTICLQETFACVNEGSCNERGMEPCAPIIICELETETIAPAGTTCEDDGNPCTTDTCGSAAAGTSGQCTHVSNGGVACGTTCITSGCCASPNSCPSPLVCPANGGACDCPSGQKDCNGSCIAAAQCCVDTDCPSMESNHQHGVCTASGCVLACDTSYVPCGTSCIPSTECCSSSDCVTPPDVCHMTQGTCTNNACTYPVNDGAACDADGNACTLDTCKGGTCMAGAPITCIPRDCHSTPSCDPTSGNCADTVEADGTACGDNGCSATAGTCASGVCSAPPMNCSTLTNACQAGICNAAAAVGSPCATTPVMNGTACAVDDKCVLGPSCQDGTCVGKAVTCTPSGPCRTSTCQSSSGTCQEEIATVGTSCSVVGSCQQNGACDDNGNCVGDLVPDGTPCSSVGCEVAATCASGTCICLSRADLSVVIIDGGSKDSSHHGCGCDAGAKSDSSGAMPWHVIVLMALVVFFVRRRN